MSEGQGWILLSPAILCPPKCSDNVPLTPTWATAASESVPSSNSKSRPAPTPSYLWEFGHFSIGFGLEGGSPPNQTLLSLPPSSQTTGLGPQRFLSSVLAQKAGATRGKRLHRPCPSSKGRVQLGGRDGATLACPRSRVSGLGSVRLFSFAVGRGGRK